MERIHTFAILLCAVLLKSLLLNAEESPYNHIRKYNDENCNAIYLNNTFIEHKIAESSSNFNCRSTSTVDSESKQVVIDEIMTGQSTKICWDNRGNEIEISDNENCVERFKQTEKIKEQTEKEQETFVSQLLREYNELADSCLNNDLECFSICDQEYNDPEKEASCYYICGQRSRECNNRAEILFRRYEQEIWKSK